MRGLLDNAVGQSGPHGAALPQSRGRSSDTHPVYYSGPGNGEGLPGAALSCASTGQCNTVAPCRAALSLGQVGQSHGSVDLPPALGDPCLLTSILLLLPVNTFKKIIIALALMEWNQVLNLTTMLKALVSFSAPLDFHFTLEANVLSFHYFQ